MKSSLPLVVLSMLPFVASADIQDPPMNDYGPTRKLGRGLANIAFGATEITSAACEMNEREGNSAGFSYGFVKGVGRFFARLGYGFYDVTTAFAPTYQNSYRPPYRSNIPWIHGGYEEFPPELGFESRYAYSRNYGAYP